MNTNNLGRLQPVDLRAIWSNEAGDFTPWLAEEQNLALLGETIGLDLELEGTEQNVGPFRADIVCKDTVTDTWVLIENQLERTDHSHLGQLITYAAGLNAVTIVWIADRFTEEHRAALDWLNEITGQDINFFGLEIELWRIGDSLVAPKFNMASKPNDWTKAVSASRQRVSTAVSETKLLHQEYWAALKEYLESVGVPLQARKPRPQQWYDFAIGRTGFLIRASTGMRDGYILVQMVMADEDAKAYFHLLREDREAIEREITGELDWRELPDKKQSDISMWRYDVDPSRKENWPDYHAWIAERWWNLRGRLHRESRHSMPPTTSQNQTRQLKI